MRRPALLRTVVCLVALALGAGTLRWQRAAADRLATAPVAPSSGLYAPAAAPPDSSPLGVIAAYTAASITAAQTGTVARLDPNLVPGTAVQARIRAESQRRAAISETHRPELVRWGVVRSEISATAAVLDLQEQWTDTRMRPGQPDVRRAGILQRVRYQLTRPAVTAPWQIVAIEVQVMVSGTAR
jgi:hypothetical protein